MLALLKRIDLNLLVTLDVVLAERNVTRAAKRLHLSQPAVSLQLAKLRDALKDPLLVAGPRGMEPTSFGAALEVPLRHALEQLGAVLAPAAPFDPASADVTWRVAASDYGARVLVQPLLPTLRRAAPGARLAVLPEAPARMGRQAEQGEIDLGLVTTDAAPEGLRRRALFRERYVLVGRKGHPALRRRPTLRQLCRLEFAIVSRDGGGFRGVVDDVLADLGVTRRVVLSVPHFLFLLSAVATSNLVAMVPARLAETAPGITSVPSPLEVPSFEMSMVWHERMHRDPAHAWLRAQLLEVASQPA